jgi:hypothetical protein
MINDRMGDVDDVEHAERDRHADRDRGIKAAEQKPGDDRVDQEAERNLHDRLALRPSRGGRTPAVCGQTRHFQPLLRRFQFRA